MHFLSANMHYFPPPKKKVSREVTFLYNQAAMNAEIIKEHTTHTRKNVTRFGKTRFGGIWNIFKTSVIVFLSDGSHYGWLGKNEQNLHFANDIGKSVDGKELRYRFM